MQRCTVVLVGFLVVGVIAIVGCTSADTSTGRLNQTCGPIGDCYEWASPIQSAAGTKAGYIRVFNTDTELVIYIIGEGSWVPGSWMLDSASVYADAGPVPSDPALYPHQVSFPNKEAGAMYIPLPVGCYGTVKIAGLITLVRQGAEGPEYLDVWIGGTPWGGTPDPYWTFGIPFEDGSEGWYIEYEVCCDGTGCTYTQGYWKNHPEDWPVDSLVIGGVTYTKAQLLALLGTSVSRDASVSLAHQLIAARLNVLSGASTMGNVAGAIADADAWMAANNDGDGLPYRVRPSTSAGAQAVALVEALTAFNEGEAGTIHCDMLPAAAE